MQFQAWDELHRAYFNGEALWTYLTAPFLLARDDVRVEEVEPWENRKNIIRKLDYSIKNGSRLDILIKYSLRICLILLPNMVYLN